MIGNKYLVAQQAHCQDMLREAEMYRLTHGRLIDTEAGERRSRMLRGLRLEGGRMKVALGLAAAGIITLIGALLLSGGGLAIAMVLP